MGMTSRSSPGRGKDRRIRNRTALPHQSLRRIFRPCMNQLGYSTYPGSRTAPKCHSLRRGKRGLQSRIAVGTNRGRSNRFDKQCDGSQHQCTAQRTCTPQFCDRSFPHQSTRGAACGRLLPSAEQPTPCHRGMCAASSPRQSTRQRPRSKPRVNLQTMTFPQAYPPCGS